MQAGQELQEPFRRISVEEARELIEQGHVRVIDVREPWEYAKGHVPNATLVPLNSLMKKPTDYLTEDNIIFVCEVGQRSAVACEVAAAVGLTNIYNLEGGTSGWIKNGCPVEQ